MTQTSFWLLLFVAGFACLPWAVRWLQRRSGQVPHGSDHATRLVSSFALSPQQRVVTVEVGPDHARTCLVLGVSPQSIHCLHVYAAESGAPLALPPASAEASAGLRAAAATASPQ